MKRINIEKQPNADQIYKGGVHIESELKLTAIDRIRIVCGSKIYVITDVQTQWNIGHHTAHSALGIEQVFSRLKFWFKSFSIHKSQRAS
jgi:hypothetical protein